MLVNRRRRLVLYPTRGLRVAVAVCCAAAAAGVGCTDPLRGSPRGTGGAIGADAATASGGRAGSGAAGASGGVSGTGGWSAGSRSGGASGSAGGASGGASGTDPCAKLDRDYCVAECLKEHALTDSASCTNGAWTCRSGYVLASSCPDQACGVTPDACCDLTTGLVTQNACADNGYREPCPDDSTETYYGQGRCVPKTILGATCESLDGQPCSGPAVGCSDMSLGFVTCWCGLSGVDASPGTWRCSYFIGP